MDNQSIAQRLLNHAAYLEGQEINIYRIRAYRQAADTVLSLSEPVADLLAREGRKGLEDLPGIGSHLSYAVESLVRTGELQTLGGGTSHLDPERVLASLPGVGPRLARRIHEQLGITTLEEMERAAHEGRLSQVDIGTKRLRGIMDALACRLRRYRFPESVPGEPSVADLFAVDEEYRRASAQNLLPTISPRRFNPDNPPWLPLFATRRNGWQFRALFSNTALAHRLGQTHDWVVIYFNNGFLSGQRTIVTETRGELHGRRVIRGRERECREYYQKTWTASGLETSDR